MLRLSPKKLEVLRQCANLALHSSTGQGEMTAAALGFFRILRNAGVSAEQLVLDGASHPYRPPPPDEPKVYREPVSIMPFGKYKGCRFEDIPDSYFDWLIRQDWLRPKLKRRIIQEQTRRKGWGHESWANA